MRFFRRSTEMGLTAYLRLPGHLAFARVDRRQAVPKLLEAGIVAVEGENWPAALGTLHKRGPLSLVLNSADYRLRVIDAPNVPREELKSAVRWQIQDSLDYHIDDATVDVLHVPHPEHLNHAPQVFVVAAKNSLLGEETALATKAGLTLSIIDIIETAQRNLVTRLEKPGRALAVFSFIESGGLLTLTLDGELCLVRTLGVGQAQLDGADAEGAIERLSLEFQRTLDHFDRQFGGVPVDRMLLVPFGQVDRLQAGLAVNLALPVDVLDLSGVLNVESIPDMKALPPACYHAIGAALRMEDTKP